MHSQHTNELREKLGIEKKFAASSPKLLSIREANERALRKITTVKSYLWKCGLKYSEVSTSDNIKPEVEVRSELFKSFPLRQQVVARNILYSTRCSYH